MSSCKKHYKRKSPNKFTLKNLEVPLNNGFRRALVRGEKSRLISVYYVSPDDKYLKDISDVYDWIEHEKQENVLNRSNFNFVAKKHTSHEGEFIIEYTSLPDEMRNDVIQKKRSVAPIIVTVENDDTLSNKETVLPHCVIVSELRDPEIELQIPERETEISQVELLIPEDTLNIVARETEIEDEESEIAAKIVRLEDSKMEYEDESMTLSVESRSEENNTDSVTLKPRHPYEYPLAEVNMNSLVEIGSHCHLDRIQNVLNGDIDQNSAKLMKSYCGNHCAFDLKGFPRVAFECDFCLVLWHTDCTGHRWVKVGPTSLIICDNCYLLQKKLNVDLPNIFCDVDKLLHSELKYDTASNTAPLSIPLKLEAIFKLCKMQWIIESLRSPNIDEDPILKTQLKVPKKDLKIQFPRDCRYFIKTFISRDSVIRDGKEPYFLLKYNMEDIDRLAGIFADTKCEMIHDMYEKSCIDCSKVFVKNGTLLIPINVKFSKSVEAVFFTYEFGQDNSVNYTKRFEALKETMRNNCAIKQCNTSIIVRKDARSQRASQLYQRPTDTKNHVSTMPGPLCSKFTVLPPNNYMRSSNTVSIPSISSQNFPKNAIPISMNQIQKISSIIKIRKRKQDFSAQKVSVMTSTPATVQYHNLVELPFHILEQIMASKNMSTSDKLHCRVANRVLKCVIDAGRVWNKVVINPGMVTGLQTMFDFFSKRNVKKMTFEIDFQESFGIDFFSSFLSRLKLYPEAFILERLSLKLVGITNTSKNFKLSLQGILNCVKSLKCLSVTSDELVAISVGKNLPLTSDTLEKLKLRNIENITKILQTNGECTPKLRTVNCGDWSMVSSIQQPMTFSQITSMRLDFSDSVKFSDASCFALLINLERIVISRPCVSEQLRTLVGFIGRHKSLTHIFLETNSHTKDQLNMCTSFGYYFPVHVKRICWKIYMGSPLSLSEPNFGRKVAESMPHNVHMHILSI